MESILYNYRLKKIAAAMLSSKGLNAFRPYRWLLKRRIQQQISRYATKPKWVRIENTNRCNANCSICPRDLMTRAQGDMSDAVFELILEQCLQLGINRINMHNYGEPLLDRSLASRIKLAKGSGIGLVTTNTNASLLDGELAESLLRSGLDALYISLDAATGHSYRLIRIGLSFDKVCANVARLVELKRTIKSNTKIILSFVVSKANEPEIELFIDKWQGRADHISISYAHNWLDFATDVGGGARIPWPCKLLFNELVVLWNGDYALCCADFDRSIELGGIADSDIAETWTSNRTLLEYRQAHLSDLGTSMPGCSKCSLNTIWWL